MSVIPSSAQYKTYILGPHKRAARVDVEDINGNVLAQNVKIIDGTVDASLTSRVSRVARFSLPDQWFPRTPLDPFSPYHAVVRIRAGVQYGDGSEELFPLFTGRVYTYDRSPDGSVSFDCEDLASDVIAARFETPRTRFAFNPLDPPLTLETIRELILEALPQAQFKADGVPEAPMPGLTWDEDRGRALDDLASSRGARWFPDGEGLFSVQPIAYEPGPVLQTFQDGAGGLMSRASVTGTRIGAANSVTVVSERTDGTLPVRITRRDTDPASPTFYGGTFGRVNVINKVQTPLTDAQAQTMAEAQLRASVALAEQWSADVVPDHTVEPEDTVRLTYRGYSSVQVIDAVTYPLGPQETMRLSTRGTVTVQDA